VGLDAVDADADELRVALRELVLAVGERAELGGADRREVGRVREEDAPAVAELLVKPDGALGGVGGEVGGGVAELDSHRKLLFRRFF